MTEANAEPAMGSSSGSDAEENTIAYDHSVLQACTITRSFNSHLGYILKEEGAANAKRQKLNYTWECPATLMPNCRWIGTGDCVLKDGDLDSDNVKSSQKNVFSSLCNSYKDILHCNKKPFYAKGGDEDTNILDSYLLHSLNHIFKTRNIIKKNDAKLAKETSRDELLATGACLDHGFTRPKVLILLPFRSIALRVIKRLIQLTPPVSKSSVEYSDRFNKEYGTHDEEDNDDVDPFTSHKSSKPSDHQSLFGGNCDDSFMIGIKFTRKSIKLYSDFYKSDMIVASPLQLHAKIEEAEVNKEKDFDYLSSIEILVIDHADIIAMQNWAFLDNVLEHLNCIPLKQHGTDIMRIRNWYLNGHAKYYRQSIILSYYVNPDINASFNRFCFNHQGKVKMVCEHKGVLPKVLLQVKQIYERFDASTIADVDDARLEYFNTKVFPRIKGSIQGGIMLFISSYFEFVRIRNFMKSQNVLFCPIADYTEQMDISRSRVWFFEGKRKIMLYTERAHFYHRYKIRGVQTLIMYSLPERKEFYPEMVNMLQGSDDMKCTVLFSRYDQLRLERIVGTQAAKRMLTSDKDVFAFC